MSADNVARLMETYDAFVAGDLERIPEFFDPEGFYRTSGVFPGMQDRYLGHQQIEVFWHSANEPWEWFEIEVEETIAQGDLVLARVHFTGRGAGSGIEVDIEAGHLIRFRDRLIVEFSAFATWQMALEEAGLAEPSAP